MASLVATDQSGIVLAINSGSSSLKLGFFRQVGADEQLILQGEAQNIGQSDGTVRLLDSDGRAISVLDHRTESQPDALVKLVEISRHHLPAAPSIIGHRVVHGGPSLLEHQVITEPVLAILKKATHFAPLHIPAALRLIRQAQSLFPGTPSVACFDTAFHKSLPKVAKRFPLPARYDAVGLHRYGFHGLSYESVVHRLADRLQERMIVAHLGSGSSLCALHWGRSIDTTMGFTPTGGIPMATRSGDLDPGVLLFLMRSQGLNADDLEALLNHESGLAGLSNGESDMRRLLARKQSGDPAAELAVDAYVWSIRKAIGAYAALLGGLDLLIFTGGIGEHSAEVRSMICHHMEFLRLSDSPECPHVIVLPAEEERQIARICRSVWNASSSSLCGARLTEKSLRNGPSEFSPSEFLESL